MPFGKFQGLPLREIPQGYLKWLGSLDLYDPLRSCVAEEFDRRKIRPGGKRIGETDAVQKEFGYRPMSFPIGEPGKKKDPGDRLESGFHSDPEGVR